MKDNGKYRDSRVIFGYGTRAVAWCLGCFCLLLVILPQVAFSAAIVVRGNLNLGAKTVTVDSFDSTDPTKSTNGQFDPAKEGDHGDIYAGFIPGLNPDSVVIGNSLVCGTLFTDPSAATISLGPNGAIGTHTWIADGGFGIEPGFSLNTNLVLTDVTVPAGLQYIMPAPGQVVLQFGPPISQTFTAQSNLPTLGTNQSFTSITTNLSTVTTVDYPGPVPGLTTNISGITNTTSYPGDEPGLETNCSSFVTVTNDDPGPQPCLTVTSLGNVTTSDYPGPVYGLVTNTIITPPCITAITNGGGCSDPITSTTLPDSWCVVNGITTNCGAATTTASYPASGTFCPGTVITNHLHGLPGGPILGYTYNLQGDYTYTTNDETVTYSTNYNCPSSTNYTYTYPATNIFTYANQSSYSYEILTYSYPQVASYDYTIYTAWTYVTNSYDAVLSNGCYFATSLGNTIVTGPSTLVLASNFPIANLTIIPRASLTVYVGSGSCAINTLGIINATGVASNLSILCAPAVSSVTFGGNAGFIGILDAPEANATISLAGNAIADFSGTLVANSLNVTGGRVYIHYDESLGRIGYMVLPAYPMRPHLYPYVSSNGQFQLYVEGASSGDNCVVETSTDLMNWVPVFSTNVVDNFFEFTDTNAFNSGQCFYRTVYVQ